MAKIYGLFNLNVSNTGHLKIFSFSILVQDAEDKLEAEPDRSSEVDPCQPKCCLKSADFENETEGMNEKSKEDLSVEEKEKDTTEEDQATSSREAASFRVVWNKKNYEVTFPVDETADSLKQHIEKLTGLIIFGLILTALFYVCIIT